MQDAGGLLAGLQLDFVSIGKALLIALTAFLVAVILRRRVYEAASKRVSRDIASIVSKTIAYTVILLGIIAALAQLGVDISVFLVAGGIAGIIIGIASQTVASNFLSGLFLYFERPFKEGDPVSIDGVGGIIYDVSIMSSKVRRWDGVMVRIPNDAVFKSRIEVYNKSLARRVEYRVPISYLADVERAQKTILEALEREPLVLAEPGPEAFVDNLGERGPELLVRFWAPSSLWFPAKMKGLKIIKEALEEAGIEVPPPARRVLLSMEDEEDEGAPGGKAGGGPENA